MIQALEEGAKSVELTKLVEWITKELSGFYGLEDHVNAVSGESTFCLRISAAVVLCSFDNTNNCACLYFRTRRS